MRRFRSVSGCLLIVSLLLTTLTLPFSVPAEAAVVRPFNTRFTLNTTGAITMTGNSLLTCPATATNCLAARAGTGATDSINNNNSYSMVFIDIDSDTTTFNSSRNTLSIPSASTVLWAGLYWGADTTAGTGGSAAPTVASRGQVRLRTPGSATYTTVSASQIDDSPWSGGLRYQGFADVTTLVRTGRSGEYTVANLQAGRGNDRYGGWALVVAYQDPTEPLRNLTIFDGYAVVQQTPSSDQNVAIPVSGFLVPPTGPVRTRLGVVAYEGDLGLLGDSMRLNSTPLTNSLNPSTNFFNGSLSALNVTTTSGDPFQKNLLGFDIDTINADGVLANGATSATINLNTNNDTYFPGVVTFSTELFAPRLDMVKSGVDINGGALNVGDDIRYTIETTNNGQDSATNVVLSDNIPAGTTYVPGSLQVDGATVSDSAGNDTGEIAANPARIVARLGTGATGTTGGTIAIGGRRTVSFTVRVGEVPVNEVVSNFATSTYSAATSGLSLQAISNTVVLTPRPRSDLSLGKTGPNTPVNVPGPVAFQLTALNRGPATEPAAVVTDNLPVGFTATSAVSSQGSCTINNTTRVVQCQLGSLAADASAVVNIFGTVASGSGSITNTATVTGDNLDLFPNNNNATAVAALNNPPSAINHERATENATPVTVPVLTGSSDPDGDPLTTTAAGPAANGTVVLNPNGTVTYTPNTGFVGVDTFPYTISDGRGGFATALVTITVAEAPAPSITVDKATTTASITAAGQVVPFTFGVTNTGNVTLTGVAVNDPLIGAVSCPTTVLARAASTTCSGSYTATQADIDAGGFTNTATATGTPPNGPAITGTDSVTVTATSNPNLTINKATTTTAITTTDQVVPFTFEVTNTGNVTLTSIGVSDPLLGPVSCPVDVLAPAASTTCSGSYTTTQADIDAGGITNTATATGTPPTGPATTGTDSVTVTATSAADISLNKATTTTAITAAGQVVPFTFEITNTGNVTLTGVGVSDPLIGAVSCPATTLAPNASTVCTGNYTAIQADVDAGGITNTATASGTPPTGPAVSAVDSASTSTTPAPSITVDKATTTTSITAAGQVVPFTFEVTNTGNVTLNAIDVDDPLITAVSCPVSSLAPGISTSCTGSYSATQADVDSGAITNTATVSGTPAVGPAATGTDAETIVATSDPVVVLDKGSAAPPISFAGEQVNFTFQVTNNGNVTLGALHVADSLIPVVACPVTTLAPTESTTCTGTYVVTQADLDAGGITNTATALADPPSGPAASDTDSVTLAAAASPSISMDKTASISSVSAAGDQVSFSFAVTNTGNVTLDGLVVTDPLIAAIDCPVTTLGPDESTICSGIYAVTQINIDNGGFTNNATASANPPTGPAVNDGGSATVAAAPTPALTLEKSSTTTALTFAGQVLPFRFEVTNIGNVTLNDLTVDDPIVGAVSCPVSSLAPSTSTTCSAFYVVTQLDIDDGGLTNTATASATPPVGAPVEASGSVTVPAVVTPGLGLRKTAGSSTVSAVDEVVTFSFELTNTGNVTLTNPGVTDLLVPVVVCPGAALAPGDVATCTGDYTVTQADLDAGRVVNAATATATPPTGPAVEATDSVVVPADVTNSITLVKATTATSFGVVGEVVPFTFEVANTGTVTVIDVVVDDPLVGAVVCSTATLAPGASVICTGDYVVTQADLDAGSFTNTASVSAVPPSGPALDATDSVTVNADVLSSITLDKATTTSVVSAAGQVIAYTFEVTNTGNVTVDDVRVTDPLISSVDCPVTVLAPNMSTTCTGSYTVTQPDVDAGQVTNTATAFADPPTGASVSATDTATASSDPQPSLTLDKSAASTSVSVAGDLVDFEFVVTNTGNVTLNGVAVTDPLVGSVACPPAPLAPGESTTCTATYAASQADIDAGGFTNTAVASATPPVGDAVTGTDSVTVTATPAPSATFTKTATTTSVAAAGETVDFTFEVTNTGNVTLDGVTVTDALIATISCPTTSLAPAASTTCSGVYTVTQADIDNGGFTNTATLLANPPTGPAVTVTDSATVDATPAASVSLDKTTTTTTVAAAGELVNYTFGVTNTGNVTLNNVAIIDPLIGSVSCPTTTLAPTASTTCTGVYVVAQTNIDDGGFTNTATVTADSPTGSPVSATDSATVTADQTTTITLDKTTTTTSITAAGQIVPFTFAVTNTGNVTVDAVTVSDPLVGAVTCPVLSLAPNDSTTCTGSYTVTLDDMNTGQIINTATASGNAAGDTVSATDSVTVPVTAAGSITLDKATTTTQLTAAGQIVPFTFAVTNTGNVTINNLTINDPLIATINCPATNLAPNQSTTCTGEYSATQPDIDAGQVTNTATATATTPAGATVTSTDSASTSATADPAITINKTTTTTELTAANQTVPYTFTVTNTGNVTLDAVVIDDPLAGPVTCDITTLAPAQTTTCQADYTTTQTDIDNGAFTNTATVTATPATGPPVTSIDSDTVNATATPSIDFTKTTTTTELLAAGQTVPYTFTVTNTGNVTLAGLTINDPLIATINCPQTTLAPDEAVTCTANYTVTQTNLDNGGLTNTATVSTNPPTGPAITGTAQTTVGAPATPAITLNKTTTTTTYTTVDETITYDFNLTNTGNVTLTAITINDPLITTTTCPTTTLAPAMTTTCTGTSTITQPDLDNGTLTNTATVSANPPTGPATTSSDAVTINAATTPAITLDKTSTTTELTQLGQVVPFEFSLTNTGNVTLTGITVDDPLIATVTCPATSLAPGNTTTCSGDYIVTQPDLDTGSFTNTATASATPPAGDVVTATDSVLTPSQAGPAVTLNKLAPTGDLAVDEIITYSFVVANIGNVTLTNVGVDDPLANPVDCPTTQLVPGESVVCTASYTVTQTDVDAGLITNTATTSGQPPTGDPVTATDTERTAITRTARITLDKATSDIPETVGQLLDYSFTVTNAGNVTLIEVGVADPLITTVSCPTSTLAPATTIICTGSYQVTQTDIDSGRVVNTATATGRGANDVGVSASDTETSIGTPAPAISIDKLAPTGSLVAGATLTYFFDVENTGNATLTEVQVTDALTSPVICPTTVLAPGDSMLCEATYVVTQADADTGKIVNEATASGRAPSGATVSASDEQITPIIAAPQLAIDKQSPTGSISVGNVISYDLVLTNVGNVTLNGIVVDDPTAGPVSCPTNTLAPTITMTCTVDYTVTQADTDRGSILNTATATATTPFGESTTATDSQTTPVDRTPQLALVKTSPVETMERDAVVTYTFLVTNTGDVTISDIVVADPLAGAVACDVATLAPGESANCTADYVVSQGDVDAGVVRNTATVSGNDPAGGQVETTAAVDTVVPQTSTLSLTKQSSATGLVLDQVIEFTFEVTNTGTVTLDNLAIADPTTGPVVCPVTRLAPGESTVCSASYVVTQTNVDAGSLTNSATATATAPDGSVATATDTKVVDGSPDPSITLDKTAAPGPYLLDDVIAYSLIVRNTGNVSLVNISIDDALVSNLSCPATTLAPGAQTTCTASHTVSQADVDAGRFDNTATVSAQDTGGQPLQDDDLHVSDIAQNPAISFAKNPPVGDLVVGATITYPFTVTNSGDVTLTNVGVTDPMTGPVACDVAVLSPGESTVCTADLLVQQADVDRGRIVNTATATGDTPFGSVSTAAERITSVPQNAGLELVKTGPVGSPSVGDTVSYQFVVTNVGTVTLADLNIDDPVVGAVDCPRLVLGPTESIMCNASYVITQADIDLGQVTNTATATANTPGGSPAAATDQVVTPLSQNPLLNLDKQSVATAIAVGSTVEYVFVVTNVGDVTIDAVAISDPRVAAVACDVTNLAPGQVAACRGEYVITQADVDAGRIINVATATGTTPDGAPVSDSDSETIEWQQSPQFELTKLEPEGTFAVGETLLWRFTARNTGDVTLTNLVITDPLTTPVICTIAVLSPDSSTDCTAESVVTQADVDAGEIVNLALATVTTPNGTIYTSTDTITVRMPSAASIAIDKVTGADLVTEGDIIGYTFGVTNNGNVTLSNVVVEDPMTTVTCPATLLVVGASMTCTASVTVSAAMANQSEIVNTATVIANDPLGNIVQASDTETTRTAAAPTATPTPTTTPVPTATTGPPSPQPGAPTSPTLEGPGIISPPPVTPPASAVTTDADPLAHTGDTSALPVTAAVLLLAAGGAILVSGRRRN